MVPNGWISTKLNAISSLVTKGATPTTYGYDFVDQNINTVRFIGAYNCTYEGKFKSNSGKWISKEADLMLKRSKLKNGDSIICIVGNTIGSSFLVEEHILPANINQNVALIRPILEMVDPLYLQTWITSSYIQWQVKVEASTQAQPSLSLQQVGDFKINLPPLLEQQKIAQILSTWDRAISATEKLLENSQQQKKALMQQLLTGKKRLLDERGDLFESKFKSNALKELFSINKGQQLNRDTLSTQGNYAVINGGIEPSGYTDVYNVESNTITISEGGNSCGYISFQRFPFWCGGHCYALSNYKLNIEFIYHLLKFNERQIMRLRVGSGLPNIQKKDLECLVVSYPDCEFEQAKIADVLSLADQEIETLQKKLDCLKQEKKALMQQLLTGKKRVKVAA